MCSRRLCSLQQLLCTSWKLPEKGRVECISRSFQTSCIGYLGYPFLKMRVNDDSPSSFPLLLQDQMGGDKVSCLAVSLLVLV
jgi:hypothetical protein